MAESDKRSDLSEALKPFFQRASEAEDRLSRIEIALASKKDAGNEDHLKIISDLESKLVVAHAELVSEREKISDLESKLEIAHAELVSERENVQKLAVEKANVKKLAIENANVEKLTVENVRLRYRILHLVRALNEATHKLEQVRMH